MNDSRIETITCPNCGSPFDLEAQRANQCKYCKSVLLVSSLTHLEKFDPPQIRKYIARYSEALKADPSGQDALLAIGICYLRLKLFDLANSFLQRLIDAHPSEPSGYYYRAIAHFKGKRPRRSNLDTVRQAEALAETAATLDPASGRIDVLRAAIKHDYYLRNGLSVPEPSIQDLVASAESKRADALEVEQLFTLMQIEDGPLREHFLE